MNTLKRSSAVLLASMCCLLASCEQKDLAAEFDKVQNGMSLSQVQNMLGSGTDDTPSAGYGVSSGGVLDSKPSNEKVYVWKEGITTYTVIFKDGKVVQKTKAGQ